MVSGQLYVNQASSAPVQMEAHQSHSQRYARLDITMLVFLPPIAIFLFIFFVIVLSVGSSSYTPQRSTNASRGTLKIASASRVTSRVARCVPPKNNTIRIISSEAESEVVNTQGSYDMETKKPPSSFRARRFIFRSLILVEQLLDLEVHIQDLLFTICRHVYESACDPRGE